MADRPVVGLVAHPGTTSAGGSVATLLASLESAARRRFRVRRIPAHRLLATEAEQARMLERLFADCDVVISTPVGGRDAALHARVRPDGRARLLLLPLGGLPRGAHVLRVLFPHLRRGDVIAVSCSADRRILDGLVEETRARVELLPFGVDTARFAAPSPARRRLLRRQLGFEPGEVWFLYAGRVTTEKNVHGVLWLLADVMLRHPQARLAIAGPARDAPFAELGVGPFDVARLLDQVIAAFPVLRGRLRLFPELPPPMLVALYGAADVFVSLTLHHDENFGYAPVEAMSCGLPVVGSDWGGLRDTVGGAGGLLARTTVTARGVRIDRREAFAHCARLLDDASGRAALGAAGRARAAARFSLQAFEERLVACVEACLEAGSAGDDNRLTPFGRRFDRAFRGPPRYDDRTYGLYRRLIAPYASEPRAAPPPARSELWLAVISFVLEERRLRVLDPLWPGSEWFECTETEAAVVRALEQRALNGEPFVPYAALRREFGGRDARALSHAVRRLVAHGVVGRTAT